MSIQEDKFKEIANAIRPKLGTTELIEANNFAKKVGEIKTPTDGSIPTYQGSNVVYPSQSGTILATNQNYLTSDISVRGDQNFKAENIKKDVKIWGVTGTLEESKPYIELPYLETSNGYIDTGFNPNPVTTRIVYKCQMQQLDVTQGVFGINPSVDTSSPSSFCVIGGSGNRFNLYILGNATQHPTLYDTNTIYNFDYFNNKIEVNGSSYTSSVSRPNNYLNGSIYLGACNLFSKPICSQKIYKCQIWDNGKLVRDMIPVSMQGQNGLYDKANGLFYPLLKEPISKKIKSYTFTKNGEVSFPRKINVISFDRNVTHGIFGNERILSKTSTGWRLIYGKDRYPSYKPDIQGIIGAGGGSELFNDWNEGFSDTFKLENHGRNITMYYMEVE